jgi:F-type H+-transporting ATPase subunit g
MWGVSRRNAQTVQNAIAPLKKAISNPSSVGAQTARAAEKSAQQAVHQPQSFLEKVRNMDAATLTSAGVVAAETIGFFSVGEMIGRFKIIGYRSTGAHAHH